ncbi:MAG: 2-oxoacid:ferredoxin oxidoreductase subunit beta [Chloroflexi bacterium]|nr:2-oxoacid:ferredoxin oxidoreductase subunit beta [Chloroflexota bacterium]
MVTVKDYEAGTTAWCPGCGNFGILTAVKKALVELGKDPHEVLFVSGIGQAGKFPHYLKCNAFNGLHGRALPVATAAKLANHRLTVIAVGGDGDGYGEGGNHFVHAMHRNVDITYLVHNNQVYALTKGQVSPTSDEGFVTKTSPRGALSPIHPTCLALAADCSFIARSFAGDIAHLTAMVKRGIQHRGFAFIDILQPCVSFNHKNTFAWYRERVYKLEDEPGYDPTNLMAAFARAHEWGERIPTGVFYQKERPTLEDYLSVLKGEPLVKQGIDPRRIAPLMQELI